VCPTERITRPIIDDHLANQDDKSYVAADRQQPTRADILVATRARDKFIECAARERR
jgi:hypothetical protein